MAKAPSSTTSSSRRSSRRQAALAHRPGRIFNPRSKAEWLLEEYYPEDPTFTLDPEVVAAIPKDLPGEVPSNGTELYADQPPRRRRRAQSADDAE
jgi:hypothetical protein